MLDDEKINRETMIEARYKDISNLETKFTSIIENEISVSYRDISVRVLKGIRGYENIIRYLERIMVYWSIHKTSGCLVHYKPI